MGEVGNFWDLPHSPATSCVAAVNPSPLLQGQAPSP